MKAKHGESTIISRRLERHKLNAFRIERLKEIRLMHLSRKRIKFHGF